LRGARARRGPGLEQTRGKGNRIMADETYRKDYDPNWRDSTTDDPTAHDDIQHGIDDNPTGDAEKGAVMGGLGGAAVGAAAGAMTGPGGAVLGAVIGGVAGAVASGAAVGAVDKVDNDNTVSGLGSGVTPEKDATDAYDTTNTSNAYDTSTTYDNTQPALRKSWDVLPESDTGMVTAGPTGSNLADSDIDFRSNWQNNYYGSGSTFDEYQPAYHYGYLLYSETQFANRDWPEFEDEARSKWEIRHPGTWDRFKNAIRYGWERAKAAISGEGYDDMGRRVA